MKLHLAHGKRIKSWSNNWIDRDPLKDSFPAIYALSNENSTLFPNTNVLSSNWTETYLQKELWRKDDKRRTSSLKREKPFLLASLLKHFLWKETTRSKVSFLWLFRNELCLQKRAFTWEAWWDRLNKLDGILSPQVYPLWFQGQELVDHLLIHCKLISSLWRRFLAATNISWLPSKN